MSKIPVFLLLLSIAVVASSCTQSAAQSPTGAIADPQAPVAPPESTTETPAADASAASASRPPPPTVTAPLDGEPTATVLAEARLVTSSCEDDEQVVKERIQLRIEQMRREVDEHVERWRQYQPHCWRQYSLRGSHGGRVPQPSSAPSARGRGLSMGAGTGMGVSQVSRPASASTRAPKRAESASGTNNQVAGVDEADIVKNDGRYVYLAMNGALRIVEALEPRLLSVTKLPGNVRELFVSGDRAVVYLSMGGTGQPRCTYAYDCQFAGDGSSTRVVVLDISNRSLPRVMRDIKLSGSLMASRRIGKTVHTVLSDGDVAPPPYPTWPPDLRWCGMAESYVRTQVKKLKKANEAKIRAETSSLFPTLEEKGVERQLCDNVFRTRIADGEVYTTLMSFDMHDDGVPTNAVTLQSRPGAVFASADALYLSVVHRKQAARGHWYSFYPTVEEVSDIHKFRIGAEPEETRYIGSGVVPGHVLNQFAMDEWYGYLRVATSRGRVPDPRVESVVSILAQSGDGNLVRVGAIDHIAPGEDIRAVRFDGDRGYVVTFKKTDPLFVLDLYHPQNPRILGELKIPGFSTYMHRIDPDHLLSIGFDADDRGDFAYFDGILLQLFDVTEPTDPKLIHKEKIGTRGSSSEAATHHLAFNYFAETGKLAFPITVCEGGEGGRHGTLSFSGLLVYDVSVKAGFERLGGIDHGTQGVNCGTWWLRANSAVKRSIFLDELVYSIATDRLKVQRMGRFGSDVADIALMP